MIIGKRPIPKMEFVYNVTKFPKWWGLNFNLSLSPTPTGARLKRIFILPILIHTRNIRHQLKLITDTKEKQQALLEKKQYLYKELEELSDEVEKA